MAVQLLACATKYLNKINKYISQKGREEAHSLPVWQEAMKYERELIIKFVNISVPCCTKKIVQYSKVHLWKYLLLHGQTNKNQIVFTLRDLKMLKSHHVINNSSWWQKSSRNVKSYKNINNHLPFLDIKKYLLFCFTLSHHPRATKPTSEGKFKEVGWGKSINETKYLVVLYPKIASCLHFFPVITEKFSS